MAKRNNYIMISVWLRKDIYTDVKRLAKENELNLSDVVRKALRKELKDR